MIDLGSDVVQCARLLGRSAPGILAACLALPPRARNAAIVLGAANATFLDEARREGVDPETVVELRERVVHAFAGRPDDRPLDRAIAELAREERLPRAVFDAALDAAEWDATGRRYATIDNLLDYCVRAGGAPGIGVAWVLGERKRDVLARACDMGIGVALVMIARDVGRLAREGRVLLPLEWLEEAGVDVDTWIARPTASEGVRTVVARTLSLGEGFLRRADPGLVAIRPTYRPAVRALRYSYALEAASIAANRYDTVDAATLVPLRHRARLLARALRPSGSESRTIAQPPTPGTAFLLDEIASPG